MVVTSRKYLIVIPHLNVRVAHRREEDAVRLAFREFEAIRIRETLSRRKNFEGKQVSVRPHPKRGFVLRVPEDGIEVCASNTQRLLDKVMSRLDQLMDKNPRPLLDMERPLRQQLMA